MGNKKLSLTIDDLQVSTFEVSSGDENGGTVRGQEEATNPISCVSQCWSFCPADTDCCPETHTECDPTSCAVYSCNGMNTCTFECG